MSKFCELGVESDSIIGKGIEIEELFGRRVLIEKGLNPANEVSGQKFFRVENANASCPCHF